MIRIPWLIAALLCLPLPAGAQEPRWKALACTIEHPNSKRGNVLTIYFAESGQVRFIGSQYPATVTSAEINFCVPIGTSGKVCYTVSRLSGRFSASAEIGFQSMIGMTKFNGSCIPEGAKPKF
jgi:hypothetical protein